VAGLLNAGLVAADVLQRRTTLGWIGVVVLLAGLGLICIGIGRELRGLAALRRVGWCGVRLIRQVATLHGMRPGLMGTLALLRRTALSAATVAATEVAVNAATHAIMNHPLLRHLAGDVAGAGVAARRMIVLARAAAMACSPLSRG
jgi:uncharacterized membrane protein YcjF (UPF0283 family)